MLVANIAYQIRNSKFESQNKFKVLNSNVPNVLNFGHLIFGFVSDFEFRYSNLIYPF
jgi:hypothetical protein